MSLETGGIRYTEDVQTYSLPLFPLDLVICPNGLTALNIFEARYLDMVRKCLRHNAPFGIVAQINHEDTQARNFPFGPVGTLVDIIDADVLTIGLMKIRCRGRQRFLVKSYTRQQDGLLMGEVVDMPNDPDCIVPPDLFEASNDLRHLIDSLVREGVPEENLPFDKPYRFTDCAWVANRWTELLDLPLMQKQRMLELSSPVVRLELVEDILAKKRNEPD